MTSERIYMFGECPECGTDWRYDEGGRMYSHLIGVYSRERDRTVAWRCPNCAEEWPREAVSRD